MRRVLEQLGRCSALTPVLLGLLLAACTPAAPTPTPTRPAATAGAAAGTPGGAAPTAVTATTALPAATLPAPTATRPPATTAPGAASSQPSNRSEVTFRWVDRLTTPEEVFEIENILKEAPGVLDVIGDERTVTIGYDPGRITPERIREQLAFARHPVE